MEYPNGNVVMNNVRSPDSLSPKTFSPTKDTPPSMTPSTFDDASLDELDRIMDTLSTLSRETSMIRNDNTKLLFSPQKSPEYTVPRPVTGSEYSTPIIARSPENAYSTATSSSMSIPPPMTSPPRTPAAQSPRHYISPPKVMTLSALPSSNIQNASNEQERNPATMPRLPNSPYENTSILHGSHFIRPTTVSNDKPPPLFYTNPISDSPLPATARKEQDDNNGNHFFFGPLPVSPPESSTTKHLPPPTGPKPLTMMSPPPVSNVGSYTPSPSRAHYLQTQAAVLPPRSPVIHAHHERSYDRRRRLGEGTNQESLTLPAYNEKRSYLKNLEDCTLPRPRVDSSRNDPNNLSTNAARVLNPKQKSSVNDDLSDAFSGISLRRPSNKSNKRGNGKFGLQNLSKTPSRQSTSSYNSFDMGRGYASVSTAPASTHGLIQTEVLPHRRRQKQSLARKQPESIETNKSEGNCCVRNGRFLHCHMFEMFILVAFLAGLPIGIVIQATTFHSTLAFEKYFTFFGSTMLPAVLSTITPLLVISSVLTGVSNMTPDVIKRFSIFAALFYFISVFVACVIAIAFSLVIKPGAAVSSAAKSTTKIGENVTASTDLVWPDHSLLANLGYLKDDGLSKFALKPENSFYVTSKASNISASDEVLRLINLFFPAFGLPDTQSPTICNLFALTVITAIAGIGASTMGSEGASFRLTISQVGAVISRMSDIILWYAPIGVLFYVSEIVATRIDWANIGHDRPSPSGLLAQNASLNLNDIYTFNNATKLYFVTVISSIGIYSLLILPLVVSLITFTNPFSILGFRSLGPLITATSSGFSDLCIPVTLRCLLKDCSQDRECCKSHIKVDRRIARVSAVLGGIFHRGGSVIVIVCSSVFLVQLEGEQISVLSAVLIGLSAIVTSVTSLGGFWFFGSDPFMRAMVIGLTSANLSTPSVIPKAVFYFWLISRFAAFADTIIDLFAAQLLFRGCRSLVREMPVVDQDVPDANSSGGSSNTDIKACGSSSPKKMDAERSVCGENSDYEDAPLLFNRGTSGENESDSGNSRAGVASNDDSVFLPNKPQEIEENTAYDPRATKDVNNGYQLNKQDQSNSTNPNALHGATANHCGNSSHSFLNGGIRPTFNQNNVQRSILEKNNRDEISFVTF